MPWQFQVPRLTDGDGHPRLRRAIWELTGAVNSLFGLLGHIIVQGFTSAILTSTNTSSQNVTKIKPNATSGLYVGTASAGVVEVGIFSASVTQAGAVSTGTQSFHGAKTVSTDSLFGAHYVSLTFTNANVAPHDVPIIYGNGFTGGGIALTQMGLAWDLFNGSLILSNAGASNVAYAVVDSADIQYIGAYLTDWDGGIYKGGLKVQAGAQPVTDVVHGGTGDSVLTAHCVLIGEGTSPVALAAPGTAGQALVSTGASSDPSFGVVGVAGGGSGGATLTAHAVLLGEGTSAVGFAGPGATSGVPLIAQGASADPVFGTVLVVGGGTGLATLTAHAVMLGEGTSNVGFATIGTAGRVLADNGAGADPSFQSISGLSTVVSVLNYTVTTADNGVTTGSYVSAWAPSIPGGTLTKAGECLNFWIAGGGKNTANQLVQVLFNGVNLFNDQVNVSGAPWIVRGKIFYIDNTHGRAMVEAAANVQSGDLRLNGLSSNAGSVYADFATDWANGAGQTLEFDVQSNVANGTTLHMGQIKVERRQ